MTTAYAVTAFLGASWLICAAAALFILGISAVAAVWHMPEALAIIEAKLHARRDALRVQKMAYKWHIAKLLGEQ